MKTTILSIVIFVSLMIAILVLAEKTFNPELKCIDSKIYYKKNDIWIYDSNLYSGSCIVK